MRAHVRAHANGGVYISNYTTPHARAHAAQQQRRTGWVILHAVGILESTRRQRHVLKMYDVSCAESFVVHVIAATRRDADVCSASAVLFSPQHDETKDLVGRALLH